MPLNTWKHISTQGGIMIMYYLSSHFGSDCNLVYFCLTICILTNFVITNEDELLLSTCQALAFTFLYSQIHHNSSNAFPLRHKTLSRTPIYFISDNSSTVRIHDFHHNIISSDKTNLSQSVVCGFGGTQKPAIQKPT